MPPPSADRSGTVTTDSPDYIPFMTYSRSSSAREQLWKIYRRRAHPRNLDVLERMLPWWYDAIVPDLRAGRTVLVAAHGNSLRALVKHLDGMTPAEVVDLNLPTGEPLVYEGRHIYVG